MQTKTIILSLGGSLIVPETGVDHVFLKKFRELIIAETKKDKRFVIITGGGDTCRKYQEAANKVVRLTKDDSDWLGIHTTRLNAHLIKTIFRNYAHPRINKNPRTKSDLKKHFAKGEKIMVAAGWRPGWSTDFVATILAERLGAKHLINLSNVDYVYTRDPKKYKEATKIEKISWNNFQKIVGSKWDPGLNAPFDPIASKKANKLGLEVSILNGKNISNLKKCLNSQKFKGTIIT